MVNKIYSVDNLKSLNGVSLNKDDIVISLNAEDEEGLSCQFVSFKEEVKNEIDLNNNLLEVVDELLKLMDDDRYVIEIRGGSFVLNNYMAIVADVLDLKVNYESVKFPSFKISVDDEELKIFKDLLKERIGSEEYYSLPSQWKSLYYFKDEDNIYLSELGRTLVGRDKEDIS